MRIYRCLALALTLALTLPSWAQKDCADALQPGAAPDEDYVELIARTNRRAIDQDFNIDDFLRSRAFRSWFQRQNRMALRELDDVAPTTARIRFLADPQEALRAKILAIREAKHTVDITYYNFAGDEAGATILQELRAALRRGVSVRVMVDDLGSLNLGVYPYLQALLASAPREAGFALDFQDRPTTTRATFEVVTFNPLKSFPVNLWRNLWRDMQNIAMGLTKRTLFDPLGYSINRRAHDKILLIDGAFGADAIAVMGGRNLTNDYYDVPPGSPVTDAEILMRGTASANKLGDVPMGTQVQEYFDQVYFNLGNAFITRSLLQRVFGSGSVLQNMDRKHARTLDVLQMDKDTDELRQLLLEQGFAEQEIEVANTFHNMFRKRADRDLEVSEHKLEMRNSRSLIVALQEAIKNETEEISLVSPYIWLSPRQMRRLKRWLRHDPKRKLNIFTNSLMTSDNLLTPILVDSVLGPELMRDPGLRGPDGRVLRPSVASQVTIYEYGHADARALGGPVDYGRLHMKAVYLKSSKTVMIGTYNNDPRSLLLNSEGGVITKGDAISGDVAQMLERLKAQSHVWGSAEYDALRAHPKLPLTKRLVARKFNELHRWMRRLNLWWLL